MNRLGAIALVFCGGAAGALLRTLLLELLPAEAVGSAASTTHLWGLLLVNVAGAFALGVVTAVFASERRGNGRWRLLLGTGLIGGFTSYSALALLALPMGGAFPLGLILGVAGLPLGIVAALGGLRLGGALARPRSGAA